MDLCPEWLKLSCAAMAASAMVFSASAQSASQPILFSTPAGDNAAPDAPQTSQQPDFASELQAPAATFNFNAAPDSAPLPQPTPPVNAQLRQALDERKNWT